MRNALLLALALAGPAHAAQADRERLFEDVNQLYEQSRYDDAISGYRNLVPLASRSAILHFNLGNAYFRFNQPGGLGLAIACYQRAFDLAPRDPDIRHNLDFALRKAGERLVPPGTPTALFALFHLLSSDELVGLHWLAFWYCCLLGSLYLVKEKLRPRLKAWMIGGLACWALAGSWWGLRALSETPRPGVILLQNAEVRSGPGDNFPVSFKAPEGRRVTLIDKKGDWLEIGVLKEGLKGWLPANAVEPIGASL